MTSVLVVDDSAVDRRLVTGLLEKAGNFEIVTAVNGTDALSKIAEFMPSVVVTDLIMPQMDGLELVTAVRNKYPLIPVILMTSRGNEEIAVKALRHGAASYVPKAVLAKDLVDTVGNVLTAASEQRCQTRLMAAMASSHYSFALENDSSLLPPLVSFLQDAITRCGLCDAKERTRVGVALEEALANAMYHGNLEVSSSLREEDFEAYYDLARQRSKELPYRDRRIHIEATITPKEGVFVIRDDGPGFDSSLIPDPTDPVNLEKVSGRGLLLMRTFMDELFYNGSGNQVTLIKRNEPASQPTRETAPIGAC